MSETRKFHIGTVMTGITGIMYAPHIGDVYELCNHLTGEELMTHQLGRALTTAAPWMREQFPNLAQDADNFSEPGSEPDPEKIDSWLSRIELRHGTYHPVAPMPAELYEYKDAIAELREKVGDGRIVVVVGEG